jgi:hypothetical protein
MAGYHAKPNAILHKAIDRGVKPQAACIAVFCGVGGSTTARMLAGLPVSAETMARVERAFEAEPGELFEHMPDDEPKGSLRVAR